MTRMTDERLAEIEDIRGEYGWCEANPECDCVDCAAVRELLAECRRARKMEVALQNEKDDDWGRAAEHCLQIEDAVAAEREACASLADDIGVWLPDYAGWAECAAEVAPAIRARGGNR